MIKRQSIILLILTFLTISKLFGQDRLGDNIVSDSLVKKLRIKKVTENWFHDSLSISPSNTTIEEYNEIGQKIQRVHINYLYHKFVDVYEFNWGKSTIVKTQYFYDWNPYRERHKGDTVLKKTVFKYDIHSGRKLNTKPNRFEEFKPRTSFDNLGRMTERIDTIKFGYKTTKYSFDENERVVQRIEYVSRFEEKPEIHSVDSLYYDIYGQLVKEVNFYDITIKEGKWEFNREVVNTYSYTEDGLIMKKTKVEKYQSLKDREFKPTVYRYEYEFY